MLTIKYKRYIGKIVEVNVLDHEQDTSVDPKDCLKEKLIDVNIYGKFIGETAQYIVIASWVCDEEYDIYRLLKYAIQGIKVIK